MEANKQYRAELNAGRDRQEERTPEFIRGLLYAEEMAAKRAAEQSQSQPPTTEQCQ
jgi:hypothetical protein